MGFCMDFKLLNSAVKTLQNGVGAEHKETSELSAFQGFCCLLLAEQEGFQNRERLKKAADAFGASIQFNRKNPDPYLGLAYLFIWINEPESAAAYLDAAAELAPDHPDLTLLKQWIHPATSRTVAHDVETDGHYELLEHRISDYLFKLNPTHAIPSVDPERYLKLQEQHRFVSDALQTLKAQISDLQGEIDTFDLEIKLDPLYKQLRAFEIALKISQTYLRLRTQIIKNCEEVDRLETQLAHESNAESIKILEAKIEILLDQCDAIADQLDEFDKNGHDISSIEKYYNELCEKIEILQDSVEDTLERLSKGVN